MPLAELRTVPSAFKFERAALAIDGARATISLQGEGLAYLVHVDIRMQVDAACYVMRSTTGDLVTNSQDSRIRIDGDLSFVRKIVS